MKNHEKIAEVVFEVLRKRNINIDEYFYSFPDCKRAYFEAFEIDMDFGKYVVKWVSGKCKKYGFVDEISPELKESLRDKKIKPECKTCDFCSWC